MICEIKQHLTHELRQINSYYMFPPKSFEFNVTIIEPIQTIKNTCANSGPPLLELIEESPCKILKTATR